MAEDLGIYRKSYEKGALNLEDSEPKPLDQFDKWFKEWSEVVGQEEVNVMSLSTIGLDGFPKTRIMLLKEYNADGFVFYTNYSSEKGKAMEANPNVCLNMFWPKLERQVVIKGVVENVAIDQATAYFHSRPRGSQLGAWTSPQSQAIPDRAFLENRLANFSAQYEGQEIPKPEHWGGLLVRPISVEFWQGRPNRLHDRILYLKDTDNWTRQRLAP